MDKPDLQTLIAQLGEREWPSEETIRRMEENARRAQRATRAAAAWKSYTNPNHLSDRHRKMALAEPTDGPGNRDALERAKAITLGTDVLLYGPRGTGKTHMAVWLAGQLVKKHGVFARFTEWPEYLNDLIGAMRQKTPMADLMAHEVLILDDVDKRTDDGRQSSFAGETLFDVLRRLNYETRTTIITSNRDPVKLAKMFYQDDENRSALASRLAYQMETIYVGGHDRRKGDA